MTFKDHFSDRATLYSQYRPKYPDNLFDWLKEVSPNHEVVWDCATGSGQAAVGLARIFRRVIATDASEKQIAMAEPHQSIDYRIAPASESGLDDRSVDAVTVAQAIHWFDHESFFAEVRRVLRPGGLIAVWAYGDPVIDDPSLDRIIHDYNRGTIESYWRPERDLILGGLRGIPFPFQEIAAPSFVMEREWSLDEMSGYMRTWSATAAYAAAKGIDPVVAVEEQLRPLWRRTQRVTWPLHLRAGFLETEE